MAEKVTYISPFLYIFFICPILFLHIFFPPPDNIHLKKIIFHFFLDDFFPFYKNIYRN